MPFPRPTLSTLRQQAAADINGALAGADGLLRRANLNVIGTVQAGFANLQYGYLDWIALQAVPFTATGEYLQAWGALKDIYQQGPQAASGGTTFSGTPGTDIPLNTILVRADGATFISTADVQVGGGGTIQVPATAQTAGSAGNTPVSSVMSISQAIEGVTTNGTVTLAYTGGTDTQSPDSFRSDVLQAFANPPQGGAAQDYVTWALAVNGVTRAWCLPNGMGSGTVIVYTMFDESESAYNGFPQGSNGVATGEPRDTAATGDQLAVANYIFGPYRQPVTALVYSCAPIADPKNFTITNLNPNTTAMKTAVAAAITDTFLREGTPGGVRLADGTTGGTIALADVIAGIDAVPGLIDFIVTSPATDIVSTTGYLATLGTITW
jgi:uncharacterized phage protein gp47/JayE